MRNVILFCLFVFSISLSASDKYDIIVDRNGTGDFRNIQQALDSVKQMGSKKQINIFVKNGLYKEKLVLDSLTSNVIIIGESKDQTIINYDDHANINNMGTFNTYTFLIRGNDIIVENLTIENTAAQQGQAVALHIEGDRVIVRNCKILGNQDTIYVANANCRHYFENCYIEGTTDFIFGPATSWFERCEILCKKNSYITAANTPANVKYGIILNDCNIKIGEGVTKMYLGRPWRPYAMTIFMNCDLPRGVKSEGWDNWRNPENEKTARYFEYKNKGEGADISKRVNWIKILSNEQAKEYTIQNVLKGSDNWNPINH